jgi:hypothetical protein
MGRLATKSPECENLEKCHNTKLEGDQFQDTHTPLTGWGFYHEDVTLTLNLKMTPKSILHSLMQLEAHKNWPYATP